LFTVEIPEDGRYALTVRGTDGRKGFYGALVRCLPGPRIGAGSTDGLTGGGLFTAGKHVLQLTLPGGPEPRGEVSFRLEYIEPPP
jgi:hypothetical protein